MRNIAYGVTVLLTVIAIAVEVLHGPTLLLFATASFALMMLAWLLGLATESLGDHMGPRIGGLLNATFGNAAELIITLFALSAGLTAIVKASILGSVIGNVLLVLGASIFVGGLKNGIQNFSSDLAGINAALLAVVATALALPTIFAATHPATQTNAAVSLSIAVAVILLVLYGLYLIYFFRSQEDDAVQEEGGEPLFGLWPSVILLLVTTVVVAYVSEGFVGAIEPLVEEYGVSELFVGVILVPIIGNIAEHVASIQMSYKNRMDFSMAISLGSAIQVALFVTGVLVLLGPVLGHPLALTFTPLELGTVAAAVIVTAIVALDGRSNWMEGAMLLGVYIIAALAFYFLP